MSLKESFKINDFITLKLVNDRTIIYLDGKKFIQCIGLLFEVGLDNEQEKYNSIDEIADRMDDSLLEISPQDEEISPKEEFWGHCSNLQAWVEHNYDTRLIHQNLAFPMLKRLTELSDPQARKVFKEEIGKRLQTKLGSVTEYLYEEGYVDYLTREAFWSLFGPEAAILEKIEKIVQKSGINCNFKIYPLDSLYDFYPASRDYSTMEFKEVGNKVVGVSFDGFKNLDKDYWTEISTTLSKLKNLDYLYITYCNIHEIPKELYDIKSLRTLYIRFNKISSIQRDLLNLENLEELFLAGNRLEEAPIFLKKLKNLRFIDLNNLQND